MDATDTPTARTEYVKRTQHDMLYMILTTNDPMILNPHIEGISRLVQHRALNSTVTKALEHVHASNNANLKHALILFCLHAEPSFREYIGKRSNEKVVGEYVVNNLHKLVHACLTGHFQNVHEFVNAARIEYLTT